MVDACVHVAGFRADLRIDTAILREREPVLHAYEYPDGAQPVLRAPFLAREVVGQLDVLQAQVGAVLHEAVGIAQRADHIDARIVGVGIVLPRAPALVIHLALDVHALAVRVVAHLAQVEHLVALASLQEEVEIPVLVTEAAVQAVGEIREGRAGDVAVVGIRILPVAVQVGVGDGAVLVQARVFIDVERAQGLALADDGDGAGAVVAVRRAQDVRVVGQLLHAVLVVGDVELEREAKVFLLDHVRLDQELDTLVAHATDVAHRRRVAR